MLYRDPVTGKTVDTRDENAAERQKYYKDTGLFGKYGPQVGTLLHDTMTAAGINQDSATSIIKLLGFLKN